MWPGVGANPIESILEYRPLGKLTISIPLVEAAHMVLSASGDGGWIDPSGGDGMAANPKIERLDATPLLCTYRTGDASYGLCPQLHGDGRQAVAFFR